jgi:hypothetical protein
MKLKRITGILLIFFVTTSCHRDYFSIEDAVKSSKIIIHHFDNNSINKFRTWQYWWRGAAIWDKHIKDSICYRIIYFPDASNNQLRVISNFSSFFADFPLIIKVDTFRLLRINFQNLNDKGMKITTEYSNCPNPLTRIIKNRNKVFQGRDPFQFFDSLNIVPTKFQIFEIQYSSWSDCFNFSITPTYHLIYVPDSSILKINLPRNLRMDLMETYRLNRNWFLKARK